MLANQKISILPSPPELEPNLDTPICGHSPLHPRPVSEICPNVREIQADLLKDLAAICNDIGAKLILADIALVTQPTVWVCCDLSTRGQVLAALTAHYIRVYQFSDDKRVPVDAKDPQAVRAIAYKRYVVDGVVMHGAASGIYIEFCAFDADTQVWTASKAGVESAAPADYLDTLDHFDFVGITLPILHNAFRVWETHPSRQGKALILFLLGWMEQIQLGKSEKQPLYPNQTSVNTQRLKHGFYPVKTCCIPFVLFFAISPIWAASISSPTNKLLICLGICWIM